MAGNRSKDQLQVFTEYSTYCFYYDPPPLIELLRYCYLATGAFEIHSDIGSPRAFLKTAASDKTSVLWQTSPLSALLLFRFLWIFFFITPSFPTWAEGHWEDVFVDSSTLVIKDQINFKTYSSKVEGLDGRKVSTKPISVCAAVA